MAPEIPPFKPNSGAQRLPHTFQTVVRPRSRISLGIVFWVGLFTTISVTQIWGGPNNSITCPGCGITIRLPANSINVTVGAVSNGNGNNE